MRPISTTITHDLRYLRAACLLSRFLRWAEVRSDIRTILVVGSFARAQAKIGSDVDIRVLTHFPAWYEECPNWVSSFCDVVRLSVVRYPRSVSITVATPYHPDLEIGIADTSWGQGPRDSGISRTIDDGVLVLLDRDGTASEFTRTLSS